MVSFTFTDKSLVRSGQSWTPGSTKAVPWQYLALLDEVSSLPEVEDDVPRHPGGEQSAGHLANRR